MRFATASYLSLSLVGLLTGCPDRTISEVNPEQGRVDAKDIPVTVNRDLDILFVIDDSPSMADKQNNLAANFPNFINVLNTIQGGLPNLHIGVVTSDVGTKGELDAAPGGSIGQGGNGGCSGVGKGGNLQTGGAPVTGAFISDIQQTDGSRMTNYTGNLAQVFGTMAKVGAGGCGFEQHLAAMKRALNNNPANVNFLRPDAFLGVIFIQDEDDCSMSHSSMLVPENAQMGPLQSFRCTRFGVTCDNGGSTDAAMNQVGTKSQCHPNDNSQFLAKVSDYVAFLKGLKPNDTDKIVVAGVMGTTDPFQVELRTPPGGTTPVQALAHSCTYIDTANQPEVADPPTRLKFFLDQFPNRSTFTTVCQQDLSQGLQLIAQLLKAALGDPCIGDVKLLDTDPGQGGVQPNCAVSFVTNKGKPNQMEQILPECNGGNTNQPCWHVIIDAAKCPTGDNLILKVEGNPPPDAHIISNCESIAGGSGSGSGSSNNGDIDPGGCNAGNAGAFGMGGIAIALVGLLRRRRRH